MSCVYWINCRPTICFILIVTSVCQFYFRYKYYIDKCDQLSYHEIKCANGNGWNCNQCRTGIIYWRLCISRFVDHAHLCFFKIRFWYLRCCSCPWNRGRQHLATPLKTCQNIEAGFLTGWLLCLSPNSEVTASETPPFPHLGCVPAVVPAKGDHPPSRADNFARTSVCRWLPQKPTASQVEAARNPEKGGLYSDLPWIKISVLPKH